MDEPIGYLLDGEPEALAEWAAKSTGILVEIGSFLGRSTVHIARAAQHPVVSIDPHHGNPEMQPGEACFIPEAWDGDVVDSLPGLRRNLRAAGVEDKVTCIAGRSVDVAQWWGTPVGFLFIDGDHDDSDADYDAWAPHLAEDAILAFHDTEIPRIRETFLRATRDGWVERQNVANCLRVLTK